MKSWMRTAAAHRPWKALAAAVAMMACTAGACTSATIASTGSGAAGAVCAPGVQIACACPGGTLGVQVCKADGSGFDPCLDCTAGTGGGGGGGTSSTSTGTGGQGGSPCGDTTSDPHNCGACGHDCQGGSCSASTCQPVLLASSSAATAMALDATNVYWIDSYGTVMKVPIAGGAAQTLVSTQPLALVIAVDATDVYYVESAGTLVMKAPLDGASPPVMLAALGSGGGAVGIGVDATSVYVLTATSQSAVVKVPIGGGPTKTLFAGGANSWSGMAMTATDIYWTGPTSITSAVMTVPITGGPGTSFAPGAVGDQSGSGIVADATNVYWSTANGPVLSLAFGSSPPLPKTVSTKKTNAVTMAVDDKSVYWTDSISNTVMMAPIAGGTTTTLASGLHPFGIAVNATSIFWTDSGKVKKLAK